MFLSRTEARLANPRIDDLRKKLDREPGSRLFAQLAEELRKEGHLDEAIRVARHGLDKHPNYPSARMTLGRALLDSGELTGARREFEAVLKGAPDNILASRYLAECLEGLGQRMEALARYRATLALAPGDKQIIGRIEALQLSAGAKPAPAAAPGLRAPEPARPAGSPRPLDASQATAPMAVPEEADVFEVEPDPDPDDAPIPLVPVDEDAFELERPLDARAALAAATPVEAPPPPTPAPPAPLPAERPAPAVEREVVFEPEESLTAVPEVAVAPPAEKTLEVRRPDLSAPPELEMEEVPALEPEPPPLPAAEVLDEEFDTGPQTGGPLQMTFRAIVDDSLPPQAAPLPAAAAAEPELASPTLAELYFDQGFLDKAIEVYRRLLERDPAQERLQARLREIVEVQRLHAAASPAPAPLATGRKAALERTIARLQDLRTALSRRT